MNWIHDLVSRLYGSTAIENALLRGRLRALEERITEQTALMDIQIKLFAHVVPRDKLPPWLQVNPSREEAVERVIPRGEGDQEEDEVVEAELEDAGEVSSDDPPTLTEYVEDAACAVDEILDIVEVDLQPAMEGARDLLAEAHPGLGDRAKEWVDRMANLTDRLSELKLAFQQLAEEATQVEQVDGDDDDTILGLG